MINYRCFYEIFACTYVFFAMISFQGSVYVTFITHNKILFLSKWPQWNNTNDFNLGVFHLNSYKRLTRHENISFTPKWKWSNTLQYWFSEYALFYGSFKTRFKREKFPLSVSDKNLTLTWSIRSFDTKEYTV